MTKKRSIDINHEAKEGGFGSALLYCNIRCALFWCSTHMGDGIKLTQLLHLPKAENDL
jgi:hypothetical protein